MNKVLVSVFLFLVLFSSLHQFYYKVQVDDITKEIYLDRSIELKSKFKSLVEQQQGKTAALTYILSKNKTLVNALVKKDRSLLNYAEMVKGIEKYGNYENLWIQIIDKDGYSFYRSWTKKIGDHAASARVDIAQMIKDPKPMKNISTGRFDMTFKTMLPLYYKNKFIGMIELISHFNNIANTLKSQNIEPIMIVDESYTKRFIKPYSGLFIGQNYVTNKNASKELMSKIEKSGISNFLNIKDYILFENTLVTTYKINNIKDKPMGYFVLFEDTNQIDKSKLNEFQITYFKRLIILLTIIALSILLYINRRFVKSLNSEVKQQTKKIEKQKDSMTELLSVYDSNVIFSKTNLDGIITYVSNAFCEISGYSRKELIGKSHSIIKHPDTPAQLFIDMWSKLKKQEKWKGEIKNLKKGGSYYWVDVEIEPFYNEHGEHIGYSSIREDITPNKDIEDIQKEIIFAMGSIGESRSKETGNHVKRVAEYSRILAKHCNLPNDEIEMLVQASPMHDIGKVAIPDSILNKPAKLTTEEYSVMKTHVEKGYEMLKVSNRPLLQTAAVIALQHHEKWDGTGYPNNLKGENIHIYGRITAIADIFDALGSDRCYKKAWDDNKIFNFFLEESGKHFDPKLIKIFFDNIDEFLEVRNKYKDI